MRRTPRNKSSRSNGNGAVSAAVSAINNNKQQQPSVAVAVPTTTSNYHSLETIVSSDSRDSNGFSRSDDDDELSREMSLLDKEETYHYSNSGSSEMSLLDKEETYHHSTSTSGSSETTEESQQSKNPIARLRSGGHTLSMSSVTSAGFAAPPPPPAMPPPSSRSNHKQQHHSQSNNNSGVGASPSSQYESFDNKSHATSASISNSASPQKKALLSLLKEMRTLEGQLHQQSHDYSIERTALMESITKQSNYITQLEHSNQTLQKQNGTLQKQLGMILSKLDQFAKGCWKFSSSSVKKMSEALHIQVQEWGRLCQIDASKSSSSSSSSFPPSEGKEATSTTTTMEKLQTMHLQIKQLKHENSELKRVRGSNHRKLKREDSSKSVTSGMDFVCDEEVSHMSGVTQMATSTAKMMDAMSGFLSEYETGGEGKHPHPPASSSSDSSTTRRNHHHQQQQQPPQKHRVPVVPRPLIVTVNSSSPKSKPHKKTTVPTIKSPRSILKKQTSKYNDHVRLNGNGNEHQQRVRLQLQQQQQNNQHHQQRQQHQHQQQQKLQQHHKSQQEHQQAVRHKPPKSPGRINKNKPHSSSQQHTTTVVRGPRGRSGVTPTSQTSPFANFENASNDFVNADENQWASWGDEESEV